MLATLLAGIILVAAGLVRAGRFIALVPEAVIEGFTVGIALIIAVSQLKDLLGLSVVHVPADLIHGLPALWSARGDVNLTALIVGLLSIAGIGLLRHRLPWFPGSLLVIACASAAVALLPLPVDTIFTRFGTLPSGLPMPSIPHLSIARISELLPSAFVIAFLAAVESLLSAIVADRMIGGEPPLRCRANCSRGSEYRLAVVRGARDGCNRKNGDKRASGRTNSSRRHRPRGSDHVVQRRSCLARGISGDARTGWTANPHGMADERAKPLGERMRLRAGDRALFFMTMILTVASNLTIAIAVGTFAGLALRLLRKETEPEEWTPVDRSKL